MEADAVAQALSVDPDSGLADADGRDAGLDVLHGVVDRHAGSHHAARRVDVHADRLRRVLALEEQQLCGDERRHAVFHLARDEHDAFAQQAAENVEAALTAAGLLDNHRHQRAGGPRHGAAQLRAPHHTRSRQQHRRSCPRIHQRETTGGFSHGATADTEL